MRCCAKERDRGIKMEPIALEGAADDTRKRVSTACEACRIAKIRCRPSPQPGVCQKYVGEMPFNLHKSLVI